MKVRREYPNAVFLVHPECTPAVVDCADEMLSTGGMLRYVRESNATQFIIGTECGILHRMQKENPGKQLIPLEPLPSCPNMKKITLESIADALENMKFAVNLDPALMNRARMPIERMLAI
jgi:quinolinate synthase